MPEVTLSPTPSPVKVSDAEIAALIRRRDVLRLLADALRAVRRGEDGRDGAPWGWSDLSRLVSRLNAEARS